MRTNFKYLSVTTFALSGAIGNQAKAAPLPLAQAGKTQYQLVVPANADKVELNAAQQLQKYLRQITKVTFPIARETKVASASPQILVGAGQRAKRLLPNQNWKSLGRDGIVIKTVGNKLVLAGGQSRGTLYAVFQFLEDDLGCRFWTPTASTIPQRATLALPQKNLVYVPPFQYREHLSTSMSVDPTYAALSKENGHFSAIPEQWGGHYYLLGFCHTYLQLLPMEKYFKQHPEWYSDPDNKGLPCTSKSKMPHASQLCVSNPEVVKELSKNALKWIDENPQAGYISISETDEAPYCTCSKCAALAKSEGSQAGPNLKFVNEVAKIIHQKYPDFMVETLAYHGSEKPPKTIRPGKNVIIRLAPIGADYGHPLDSEWNKDVRDNIKNWGKIAPQVFIWNYVTNFTYTLMPHPNWENLGNDLRFFAANHVVGVFEQGDNITNNVGDFAPLRTWLLAKLLWNPQLDQQKLRQTFLRGYYGAAAPHFDEYLNVIEKSYQSQNRRLSTFNEDFSYLNLDVLNAATSCFEKAAAAVKNDKVLAARVQREKLSLDLAWLYRGKAAKISANIDGKPFLGPADTSKAVEAFIQDAAKLGVKRFSEGRTLESMFPALREMAAAPVPLPDFAKAFPETDVIDLQQNSFFLYGKGVTTDIVQDAPASDKSAATMPGNVDGWLIQAQLDKIFDATTKGRWHTYALVRVDSKASVTTGNAFQAGIFDNKTGAGVSGTAPPLAQVAGTDYYKVDLGIQELSKDMYVWFAAAGNAAVEKIYVDRIILIRQPA